MRVLFRAIIGLFAAVFLIFSFFLFLGLTCNNKAKSAYFRRQKYYRDFLRYFKQSRVILSFVFSAKSVVIWKPKIPSMFGKRAARYNEYCCKQRNFMLLSWQYLPSNQFSGHIFWDNSYMKMWWNNYMYSVLVKDYRCTLSFAYICYATKTLLV